MCLRRSRSSTSKTYAIDGKRNSMWQIHCRQSSNRKTFVCVCVWGPLEVEVNNQYTDYSRGVEPNFSDLKLSNLKALALTSLADRSS